MKILLAACIAIFAFVAAVEASPTSDKNHPRGEYAIIDGKQYYFAMDLADRGNFSFAAAACNSLQMKLISVETQAEEKAIYRYLDDNGITVFPIWTSGVRVQKDQFMWTSSGELFNYTNWNLYYHQPDEKRTEADVCVILSSPDSGVYLWMDTLCSVACYYICEEL